MPTTELLGAAAGALRGDTEAAHILLAGDADHLDNVIYTTIGVITGLIDGVDDPRPLLEAALLELDPAHHTAGTALCDAALAYRNDQLAVVCSHLGAIFTSADPLGAVAATLGGVLRVQAAIRGIDDETWAAELCHAAALTEAEES